MTARTLLLPLLAATLVLTACGGGSGGGSTASTAAAVTTPADAKRLKADRAEDAVGAVSVCGSTSRMRALRGELRRIDAGNERLQLSTLGFPDGDGVALRAFEALQRRESEDCDVFVADDAAAIPALVATGALYDLAPGLEELVGPGGTPLRPVVEGERAFGLPIRAAGPTDGVLVVSVHGRNPGGALELVRVLGGARKPAEK
ncbi:hypothetical protein [Patulibacter minatonensis]|uniref:hypothetical protein n=1 Tax=Patulibacter minatonensis TaxID=298163 RepID=UPI00047BA57C|nr:hypothetical protein [Patulibacter minatonensis]